MNEYQKYVQIIYTFLYILFFFSAFLSWTRPPSILLVVLLEKYSTLFICSPCIKKNFVFHICYYTFSGILYNLIISLHSTMIRTCFSIKIAISANKSLTSVIDFSNFKTSLCLLSISDNCCFATLLFSKICK